jgi:hypothetical protein
MNSTVSLARSILMSKRTRSASTGRMSQWRVTHA